MRRLLATGILFPVLIVAAGAQTGIGFIEYLEGPVGIIRDGNFVRENEVVIGFAIREFDTVETGRNGYCELKLNRPSSGSTMKIRQNTVFYIQGEPQEKSRLRTIVQLLRGSLGFKVGKLAPRDFFGVQTDGAVMAVRGTQFNVDTAADRSVLVTVPEGRVESRTKSRVVMAEPGALAAIDPQNNITAIAVKPEDIELYRQYWQDMRLEALKINAGMAVQHYAAQWNQQLPRLEDAMRGLASHQDIFQRWDQVAMGAVQPPGMGAAIRDKMAVSRDMLNLRAALPVAERAFHTLLDLEGVFTEGFTDDSVRVGRYRSVGAFYRAFQEDKRKMRQMLSAARRAVRIFGHIDSASAGAGGLWDSTPEF